MIPQYHRHILISAFVSLLFMGAAHATVIDQPLPDAAQETHARNLFRELKCVVCEGQSLADSDAALAVEMRAYIRGMLRDKKTDDEILDYFRARYGDRVLMTPPFDQNTALLWASPILLLLIGVFFIRRTTAKKGIT